MADLVKPFLSAALALPQISQIAVTYPTFVAQVVRIKLVGDEKKFRVNLSDGEYFIACVYKGSEENTKKFAVGQILRVNNYQVYVVKDRTCIIFTDFDILSSPIAIIGDSPNMISTNRRENQPPATTTTTPLATNNNQINQMNTTPKKPSDMGGQVFPISDIGPYSNRWVIRARVTNKSDIRHFKSARGEGKLFNVTLADESGEIRATAFGDAVDQFYDVFQDGQTYYVSEGSLKLRNQQFNRVNHEYEMSLGRFSKVARCDEEVKLPEIQYKFQQISQLPSKKSGDLTDVIGVLKEVQDVQSISSKTTGRAFDKRDIFLVDNTDYEVKATLWSKQAADFDVPIGSIIAFKDAKVSDFGGCTLSTVPSSNMAINPDIPEAHALKGWYDAVGTNATFASLSSATVMDGERSYKAVPRITLAEVHNSGLGKQSTPDYFTMRGFVSAISKNSMVYPACVNTDKCRKKMQQNGGSWECLACSVRAETPFYRYSLSVQIADQTGAEFMSAFSDAGEVILGGLKASEIGELLEEAGDLSLNPRITSAVQENTDKEYIFRCSAKEGTYQDMPTTRFTLQSARPIDYTSESQMLLNEIDAYGM